ncbi:MAG: hypothetical protein C0615_04135, partial [Desulfuromonas sp.]
IEIIGKCTAQNEALAITINDRLDMNCIVSECSQQDAVLHNKIRCDHKLLLFDCIGKSREEIQHAILPLFEIGQKQQYIVMYNLNPDFDYTRESLKHGVSGFLFTNDSLETFIKAIEVVLSGEIWASRKQLADCLNSRKSADAHSPDLTARETDILKILALGYSNEMIAEELCISPHTVKSHISNIFKKIRVHNRRHAVQWAQDNL